MCKLSVVYVFCIRKAFQKLWTPEVHKKVVQRVFHSCSSFLRYNPKFFLYDTGTTTVDAFKCSAWDHCHNSFYFICSFSDRWLGGEPVTCRCGWNPTNGWTLDWLLRFEGWWQQSGWPQHCRNKQHHEWIRRSIALSLAGWWRSRLLDNGNEMHIYLSILLSAF